MTVDGMCKMKSERIESLDSLRGFAALSVVIHHCLLVFPVFLAANFLAPMLSRPFVNVMSHTPLHTIWDGHEAVILFFVLSGFVLSLPYYGEKRTTYGSFLIKRFFRIYVPYLVAIGISMLLLSIHAPLLDNARPFAASSWFFSMWNEKDSFKMLVNLMLMSGRFTQTIDTATWSLVHEMRISIVFPVIPWFIKRTKATWQVLAVLSFLIIGTLTIGKFPFQLGNSIYYTAFFICGSWFAYHRYSISLRIQSLRTFEQWLFALAALLLYNWTWLIPNFGHMPVLRDLDSVTPTSDFFVSIAGMIWMSLIVAPGRAQRFMMHSAFRWLGKVSYSLYLIHPIILLTIIWALSHFLPLFLCVMLVPPVSLVVAGIMNRFVEVPAMNWGRSLATRLAATPSAATSVDSTSS